LRIFCEYLNPTYYGLIKYSLILTNYALTYECVVGKMKTACVVYLDEAERKFLENKASSGAPISSFVRALIMRAMEKEAKKVESDATAIATN